MMMTQMIVVDSVTYKKTGASLLLHHLIFTKKLRSSNIIVNWNDELVSAIAIKN